MAPSFLRRTLSSPLFKHPGFAHYCVARGLAQTAQNALSMAMVVLVVQETGRAINSSLLVLAMVLPATFFGLISGVTADRFSKRWLIFLSCVARALIMAWLIWSGHEVAALYVTAIAIASVVQFASNAEAALIPVLVPREDLTRANAINNAVSGGAQLVGFAVLAPVLLRLFPSPVLFGVCLALFAVSAAFALRIRPARPWRTVALPEAGALDTGTRWYMQGWRAMRDDPLVWRAAVELTLISTAMLVVATVIPKYIEEVLRLPVDIGILVLTPAALGIAVGLRFSHWMAGKVGPATMSAGGFLLFVAMLVALTFVREETKLLAGFGALAWLDDVDIRGFDGAGLVAMVLVAPMGFGFAMVNVAARVLINQRVPLGMQGRVIATQGAVAGLAGTLPVLAGGALADLVNVRAVLAVLAAAVVAAAVYNSRKTGNHSLGRLALVTRPPASN
jgi:MFS family permease